MTTPSIAIDGICFGPADAPILDHISFDLHPGHFMGIVGPNGAGKSTLMHLLVGSLLPTAGTIYFDGVAMLPRHRQSILQRVAFVHQLQDHHPTLPITVKEVVAMGHPNYRWWWQHSAIKIAIAKVLDQVGIVGCQHKDYRYLSGGERQRVRLARALLRQPAVLLLDEPSAALDTPAQEQLYRLLRTLCDAQGITIIMVEHDIAAISAFVDSVACLNRRIHHHAMRGEQIPLQIWQDMYGDHMHVVAHDHDCIGCHQPQQDALA